MLFALSQEQNELTATVRALLARRSDSASVRAATAMPRGYDEALWRTLCDQIGVAALAIPEKYGGAGFSSFETHVVLEELGAAMTPGPLLGSGVLAAQALLRSGHDEACARLLPGIADGSTVAALAWDGRDTARGLGRDDVRAVESGGGFALTGTTAHVLDGDHADVLLVVATTGDGHRGLFEVDPEDDGVRRTTTSGMDTTIRFGRIDLDAAAGAPLLLDAGDALHRVHDAGTIAVTALQVGAAQRGLDMTVAHAKQRVQFGRPIGSFQALKHRMADMLVAVETARAASWSAAFAAAQDDPDLARQAATAKAWCSEALNEVAAETVQLHGGIAITWEHDAQLLFKRAHATCQLFGPPHEHRQRLFDLLQLAG